MSDEEIDYGDDIRALERQIAALEGGGGDEEDISANKGKSKKKVAKKGSEAEEDDGSMDFEKEMAKINKELEDGGDDDDDMGAIMGQKKKPAPAPEKKAAPAPKAQTTQKVDPAPKAPAKPAPAPKAAPPKPSTPEEGTDENGVPEDILIEEEDKYHSKDDIISAECLSYELEHYICRIIDNNLVGNDYKDLLETVRDEVQIYLETLGGNLQSGKLSFDKYLELVKLGQKNQKNLLAIAQKKKASVTTIGRLEKRLELIETEIKAINDQLAGGGEAEAPEEHHEEKPQPKDEKKPAASEKPKEVAPAPEKKKEEPPAPPKKKYQVPKEKLETLSSLVNQYIYLITYWQQNGINANEELAKKAVEAKRLFKDPYAITKEACEKAIQNLPSITLDNVFGMTSDERNAKIDEYLKGAEESFEKMKLFGCTKEEATDTVDTIKFLKKLKDAQLYPLPEIATKDLEKVPPVKTNQHIPDDTIRLTLIKLSGAAGHRTFYLKWFFEYNGVKFQGDTDYVGSCLQSIILLESSTSQLISL
jgi:outer membrane biosynthesis protein TonB